MWIGYEFYGFFYEVLKPENPIFLRSTRAADG